MPRQASFTIMQGFAKWGRVRHNMAESLVNTTSSTTKAHRQNRYKVKCVGEKTLVVKDYLQINIDDKKATIVGSVAAGFVAFLWLFL